MNKLAHDCRYLGVSAMLVEKKPKLVCNSGVTTRYICFVQHKD